MDLSHQLYNAAHRGDILEFRELIQRKEINPNYQPVGLAGRTPLWVSCFNGQAEIAKLLLAHEKTNINLTSDREHTPLYVACERGKIELVRLLLNHPQIDLNHCDYEGVTPFFKAAEQGHTQIVSLLLEKDADVNKSWDGPSKTAPIQQAAYFGRVDIVNMILQDHRLKKDEINWTPLHLACVTQDFKLFYQVISEYLKGVNHNLNQPDSVALTPLHYLCAIDNLEMLKLLLMFPECQLDFTSLALFTPLWTASLQGKHETVKWLLASGKPVLPDLKSVNGLLAWCSKSPKEIALQENYPEIADDINFYLKDRKHAIAKLRKEIKYEETLSSHVLSMVILLSDDYLKFKENNDEKSKGVVEFLKICLEVPLEIQMLFCNYVYECNKKFVSSSLLNEALLQSIQIFC